MRMNLRIVRAQQMKRLFIYEIKIVLKKTTITLVFKMGMNVIAVIKSQSSYQLQNINAINRARVIDPKFVEVIGV